MTASEWIAFSAFIFSVCCAVAYLGRRWGELPGQSRDAARKEVERHETHCSNYDPHTGGHSACPPEED